MQLTSRPTLRARLHRLMHRLGWHQGHYEVFYVEGVLHVAYICHGCCHVDEPIVVPDSVPDLFAQ